MVNSNFEFRADLNAGILSVHECTGSASLSRELGVDEISCSPKQAFSALPQLLENNDIATPTYKRRAHYIMYKSFNETITYVCTKY